MKNSKILIPTSEMLRLYLLIFLLFLIIYCDAVEQNLKVSRNNSSYSQLKGKMPGKTLKNRTRYSRLLSLFTFVQFEKEECTGSTGDKGTCMSSTECSQRGGVGDGFCAAGFGTCCIFFQPCGSFVRENRTLFVNNNYPNAYDEIGTCQITLIKMSQDICQYRLDFDEFTLMGPEPQNNICDNDQFIVSRATGTIPIICGRNTGNHIYVDAASELQSTIVLSVVTNGAPFERKWKIRITQIPCNSGYRADEGCLQYFSGVNGRISSFNYDPTQGAQLSNQDYGICVKQERNFCGIQYTQCQDTDNRPIQSFTLSGDSNTNVPAMVGSTGNSNFCQSDYLIIPMVSNVGRPITGPSANVDRICGGILSADVTLTPTTVKSGVKPFRLWFHTDGVEAPRDVANKGFCLNYVQQPCINSY